MCPVLGKINMAPSLVEEREKRVNQRRQVRVRHCHEWAAGQDQEESLARFWERGCAREELPVSGHPSWDMDKEGGLVRQRGARNVPGAHARAWAPDRTRIFEDLKNFNSHIKADIRRER